MVQLYIVRHGCSFWLHVFVGPPELHETGTIRKHWNRATIYAETKRVPEQLSEIRALECGLKNCKNAKTNSIKHGGSLTEAEGQEASFSGYYQPSVCELQKVGNQKLGWAFE